MRSKVMPYRVRQRPRILASPAAVNYTGPTEPDLDVREEDQMRRSSVWAAVLAGGICLGLLAGCGARSVGKTGAERAPGLARPVLEQAVETADQGETIQTSDETGAVEAPTSESGQNVGLAGRRETSPSAETEQAEPAGADQNAGSIGGTNGAEPDTEKPGMDGASDVDSSDEHTHDWQPVYVTVHHDEAGHHEIRTVTEAYDEPVYEYRNICGACGATFVSEEEVSVHILLEHQGMASYSNQRVQTDTIHHDAVTEQVWVVDAAAWEEQVVTGFRCACGATQ